MAICDDCRLIQVVDPVPPSELYTDFNFNFSSWKPEPHIAAELEMIHRHVTPTRICEVGANDGRFLALLQQRGARDLLAIEPNPVPGRIARERGFDVFEAFLDPEVARQIVDRHGQFDLVVFRQVLEHIPEPQSFLAAVDTILAPGGHIFVDVPDFEPTARMGDASTLWEEHVLYFTRSTLEQLFARAGFFPVASSWYDFSGGCLAMLASREGVPKDGPAVGTKDDLGRTFTENYRMCRGRLLRVLASLKAENRKIVMYGAGVRAAAVANFVGLGEYIDFAVDDQTERQGLFLPGFNIPIVGSQSLADDAYVVLLAVNNENEAKVIEKIKSISPSSRWASICGPADFMRQIGAMEK